VNPAARRIMPLPDAVRMPRAFARDAAVVLGVDADIYGAGINPGPQGERDYRLSLADLRPSLPQIALVDQYRGALVHHQAPWYGGRLSPDGAFAAYAPNGWLVRGDGSRLRELHVRRLFSFSPDSAWLAVLSSMYTISLLSTSGADDVTIAVDPVSSSSDESYSVSAVWRQRP
jgi:hypothetical protein